MFSEYKKPMWSDGWASIRTWTNLYNDYELTHCCFGEDGESSDSGGYGEETGLTADQAAQAAVAADAAAAAGLSGEAQQAAADAAQRTAEYHDERLYDFRSHAVWRKEKKTSFRRKGGQWEGARCPQWTQANGSGVRYGAGFHQYTCNVHD